MGNFSAIPHHADRFASEDAFQDSARVACQIGGADDPHFYTPRPRNAQQYVYIHTIRILGKKKVLTEVIADMTPIPSVAPPRLHARFRHPRDWMGNYSAK